METINNKLYQKEIINDKQFDFLEAVRTNKIISVYYELRILLYLGIMLFTGGIGYFAYQNIGTVGHILLMCVIAMLIAIGFWFIGKHNRPYSNMEVNINHTYFDYILLLVALLIISLFVYIQVYFGIVKEMIHASSFISATILFLMAYRYDNRALLSMGISALAAAIGISVTPIDWAKGYWTNNENLHIYTMLLGLFLVIVAEVTYNKNIKQHFRFTYQNFGLLLFYIGCLYGLAISEYDILFAFILLGSSLFVSIYTWKNKEFLFFLYSSLACYIAISFLLVKALRATDNGVDFLAYYFTLSCIGFIVFLITKKSHFDND